MSCFAVPGASTGSASVQVVGKLDALSSSGIVSGAVVRQVKLGLEFIALPLPRAANVACPNAPAEYGNGDEGEKKEHEDFVLFEVIHHVSGGRTVAVAGAGGVVLEVIDVSWARCYGEYRLFDGNIQKGRYLPWLIDYISSFRKMAICPVDAGCRTLPASPPSQKKVGRKREQQAREKK